MSLLRHQGLRQLKVSLSSRSISLMTLRQASTTTTNAPTPPRSEATEPSRVPAARSTPKGTLLSFAAVLGLALPYFIFSKRANDKKKREKHRQERQGGAMGHMTSGIKTEPATSTSRS